MFEKVLELEKVRKCFGSQIFLKTPKTVFLKNVKKYVFFIKGKKCQKIRVIYRKGHTFFGTLFLAHFFWHSFFGTLFWPADPPNFLYVPHSHTYAPARLV